MTSIVFCICLLPLFAPAQGLTVAPDRFAQWGDIRLKDENSRLGKVAIQAKQWPLSIIYLAIHAGQTACVGEAKARGVRATNYLISRGISSDRIVFIDAGWSKDVSVEVWIWPPQFDRPKVNSDLNLKPSEVTLEKNCKIKHRRTR